MYKLLVVSVSVFVLGGCGHTVTKNFASGSTELPTRRLSAKAGGQGQLVEVRTKAQYDKALAKAERAVVLFGAPVWCVACRAAKQFWHEHGVPTGWTFILWDDTKSKKPLYYNREFEKTAERYGPLYAMPACAVLERVRYGGHAAFRIVAGFAETRRVGNCADRLADWLED